MLILRLNVAEKLDGHISLLSLCLPKVFIERHLSFLDVVVFSYTGMLIYIEGKTPLLYLTLICC